LPGGKDRQLRVRGQRNAPEPGGSIIDDGHAERRASGADSIDRLVAVGAQQPHAHTPFDEETDCPGQDVAVGALAGG
jgi:hypothetical protein